MRRGFVVFRSFSLPRFATGLLVGLAVSFGVGCLYAYAVWSPSSNDWGNEKTIATLLLAPLLLIMLVIAIFARRPLCRLFSLALALGGTGLVGLVLGAAVLPMVEFTDVTLKWRAVESRLATERDGMRADLADIAARLKQAKTIVVEGDAPDWFILRLSRFTAHPLFVVLREINAHGTILRRYEAVSGDLCTQEPPSGSLRRMSVGGGSCLLESDVYEFKDWPSIGTLLSIAWDERQFDPRLRASFPPSKHPFSSGSHYPRLVLAVLKKPHALVLSPDLSPPYDPETAPRTVWENKCFFEHDGPFPFGRGARRSACADLLDLYDVADQMFEPSLPPIREVN
jgi:hypothetical protein